MTLSKDSSVDDYFMCPIVDTDANFFSSIKYLFLLTLIDPN